MEPAVSNTAFIKFLEIKNFKTFRGHIAVGPFKYFTAIIGPNGSGKSNFVDAINFVMGADITSLRAQNWTDLIHGAVYGQPVADQCSVTVCLSLSTGSLMSFQRSVGLSSDYKINAETITKLVYLEELKKLGINAMTNSFIVSQCTESIAMKNPKEWTAIVEQLSTSGLLKDEYKRLKREMSLAAEESQKIIQKQKIMFAERKEAKQEQIEAQRYTQLSDNYAEKQVRFQLFRLFHIENDIKKQNKVLQSKQELLQELNKQNVRCENSELQKLKEDIRLLETEVIEKHSTFMKTKNVVVSQLTLNSAIQYLQQAQRADKAHSKEFNSLKDEMQAIKSRMESFEDAISKESEKPGSTSHLGESMILEYNQLNKRATANSAFYIVQQQSTIHKQKWDQTLLDSEINKKQNIVEQLKKFRLEKKEVKKRMDILSDQVNSCRQALEDQNRIMVDLKEEVGSSQERMLQLQREWKNVMEQLSDAESAKQKDARSKKKLEVVEMLKRAVPGVYDRLINMCETTHQKYNVAVTTVLNKYKEAIIVDARNTARKCCEILHERKFEVEAFFSLDSLKEKPLNECLRRISDPKNVKFVYDVLKFPSEIEKAVLFATNNALVCETPEDAMKVNDDSGYDAVALDGTFYQRFGITSRRSQNLARNAIRWDEISMAQMQLEGNRIAVDLNTVRQQPSKLCELSTIERQVKNLREHLKANLREYHESARSIIMYDSKCACCERQLESIDPKITEIETRMERRNQELEEIKQKMNMVEDDNFSNFCSRNGMPNIRSYEERVLVRHPLSVVKKRAKFQWQIDCIKSSLDFETGKKTKANVDRCERDVQDKRDALEKSKQAENKCRYEIENDNKRVEELKKRKDNWEAFHKNMVDMEIPQVNHQLRSIKTKIETKKSERQALLNQANMNDLKIPTIQGNIEDAVRNVGAICDDHDYFSDNDQSYANAINAVEFDFSAIPQSLKDLRDEAVKEMSEILAKELDAEENKFGHIPTPNMCADEKLGSLNDRINLIKQEVATAIKKKQKSTETFERVKNDRLNRFLKCYNIISDNINGIYKALTCNEDAQAHLGLDNPDEPYLGGINYSCVVPGKPFLPMSNLSSGEKIFAALALLFAINCFQPSPFLLLDQIDTLLDNTNIGKLDSFIREVKPGLQIIAVSSNVELYERADLLVGLTQEHGNSNVSYVFMYDHNASDT